MSLILWFFVLTHSNAQWLSTGLKEGDRGGLNHI